MCKFEWTKVIVSKNPLKVDLVSRCVKSGKPCTISNEFGMFCEDMCDLEECKQAKIQLDSLMQRLDDKQRNLRNS